MIFAPPVALLHGYNAGFAWFQVGAVFNRTKTAVGGGSGSLVFRQSGDLISTPERMGLIRCLRAKSLREVTVNIFS
jgi:hypothetical protein